MRIAAYEDASRLLDWEDDTQSHYSEMVGFVERSLEVLFQTQTSKNRTLQKEEIHVNVSRGGGGLLGRGRYITLCKAHFSTPASS